MHLSDNLYNNLDIYSREESLNLAAAFRLLSDDPAVAGLNRHGANQSYTREQFDNVQTQCARRGVTIIPEIEAPGHALVIVQWKPELGLDDLSMLNISHPDTIPTMKTIWKSFLPWFHSKVLHIGADEYDSSLVSEYTHFVNEMNTFIQTETKGSKSMRIWGTFTRSRVQMCPSLSPTSTGTSAPTNRTTTTSRTDTTCSTQTTIYTSWAAGPVHLRKP